MLINEKPSELTFTKKKTKPGNMKVVTMVQSKNLLSVQGRFKWTEITLALRKKGDSMTSGLGSRSFPVVRLAVRQADDNLVWVLI